MSRLISLGGIISMAWFLAACNSDLPVSATADDVPPGVQVTVTRVATHPFLARFNLKALVTTKTGCSAASDLFPDTGGVSRRNLYASTSGQLFIVGQFDVRRFDGSSCVVELIEFRSMGEALTFLGAFDADRTGNWAFIPAGERGERPFEKM